MNASVAIQVLPKAANDDELIRIVDEVIDYIKNTGLSYYVGPCETSIEGDYDQLMEIIKECQHVAVKAGAKEVPAYVKITYRPEGEVLTIEKKVTKHHEQNMGRLCNLFDSGCLAAGVILWDCGQLYASIADSGGDRICFGISCFDGTFCDYLNGNFFRTADWDFVWFCFKYHL